MTKRTAEDFKKAAEKICKDRGNQIILWSTQFIDARPAIDDFVGYVICPRLSEIQQFYRTLIFKKPIISSADYGSIAAFYNTHYGLHKKQMDEFWGFDKEEIDLSAKFLGYKDGQRCMIENCIGVATTPQLFGNHDKLWLCDNHRRGIRERIDITDSKIKEKNKEIEELKKKIVEMGNIYYLRKAAADEFIDILEKNISAQQKEIEDLKKSNSDSRLEGYNEGYKEASTNGTAYFHFMAGFKQARSISDLLEAKQIELINKIKSQCTLNECNNQGDRYVITDGIHGEFLVCREHARECLGKKFYGWKVLDKEEIK